MGTHQDRESTPLEEYSVGYFRTEDAPGLVRLFHAVYGSGYPISHFYDPAALTAANEEGRCYSIVARTTSGRVIGAWHLSRTAPYASLYEAGAGLVLKEYRNKGINNQLSAYISNEFVSQKPNIEEIFGEPVCNHIATQKSVVSERYVVTALEVALMPAETYSKEKSATGRVATLMAFRCYRPKPHRIYLPACYAGELRSIYARLDDGRELMISAGKTPGDLKTKAEMTVFDFARVARIAVREAGDDFESCLAALEEEARARNVAVFQVWLNLSHPWTGEAVESLRRKGYFLGGALPRWFDSDGLLMQKLLCPPDFDFIHLYTDESKDLLEMVKKEWQRAEMCRGK